MGDVGDGFKKYETNFFPKNHPPYLGDEGGWLLGVTYPKPRINSQVASFTALNPLNEVGRLSLNVNPEPRWYWTQGWATGRDGDGRSFPLHKTLCLIPKEGEGQRLYEVLESEQTSGPIRSEIRMDFQSASQ